MTNPFQLLARLGQAGRPQARRRHRTTAPHPQPVALWLALAMPFGPCALAAVPAVVHQATAAGIRVASVNWNH
jgi:hypothetical protein